MVEINSESRGNRRILLLLDRKSADSISAVEPDLEWTSRDFNYRVCTTRDRFPEILNNIACDLIYLDERVLPGPRRESIIESYRSNAREIPLIMLSGRSQPTFKEAWPHKSVNAQIPARCVKRKMMHKILLEAFGRDQSKQGHERSRPEAFYGRNFLDKYLDSILSIDSNNTLNWIFVLFGLSTDKTSLRRRVPVRFFTKLSTCLKDKTIVNTRAGRFEEGLYWGLYGCESRSKAVKQKLMRGFNDFRESVRRMECSLKTVWENTIIQRFFSSGFSTDELEDEIMRTLRRADLTPGNSIIYQTAHH
ncbi:MAG: hypothetical protein ABEK50_19070 [bacterium]